MKNQYSQLSNILSLAKRVSDSFGGLSEHRVTSAENDLGSIRNSVKVRRRKVIQTELCTVQGEGTGREAAPSDGSISVSVDTGRLVICMCSPREASLSIYISDLS